MGVGQRLSRSNYRAAAGQRDFSRNMNRGSQGMRFLSHDMVRACMRTAAASCV